MTYFEANIAEKVRKKSNVLRNWILMLGVAAAVGLGVAWSEYQRSKTTQVSYRLDVVETGDLRSLVSASGSLEADETVKVSSQLSGLIKSVDVNYNDSVKKGQVLAELDAASYQSQVDEAQGAFSAAQAQLEEAKATLVAVKATFDQASGNYQRVSTLYSKGFESGSAMESALAGFKTARANVSLATAHVATQSASLVEAQAALRRSRLNLERTTIIAPIDGMVIDRQIDKGQTVVASFSAPTLFVIAGNLSKLRAKILVNEADIGQVEVGQRVDFTVDAYPDNKFQASVEQIRFQPEIKSGVVAYEVIISADNTDGRLLPGMTANADIVVKQISNVLKIPSAALVFNPDGSQSNNSKLRDQKPINPASTRSSPSRTGVIYKFSDGKAIAIPVNVGPSYGSTTVIYTNSLRAGDKVIVGQGSNKKKITRESVNESGILRE